MNLFNIGPMELLLILAIALLVFGPRRLPEIARDLGRALREFQRASEDLQEEIQRGLETTSEGRPGSAVATNAAKEDQDLQRANAEEHQEDA